MYLGQPFDGDRLECMYDISYKYGYIIILLSEAAEGSSVWGEGGPLFSYS